MPPNRLKVKRTCWMRKRNMSFPRIETKLTLDLYLCKVAILPLLLPILLLCGIMQEMTLTIELIRSSFLCF